jgi:hypothetical protein
VKQASKSRKTVLVRDFRVPGIEVAKSWRRQGLADPRTGLTPYCSSYRKFETGCRNQRILCQNRTLKGTEYRADNVTRFGRSNNRSIDCDVL